MNTFVILRRAQYKGHAQLVPDLVSSRPGKLITLTLKADYIGDLQLPLQSAIILGIYERVGEPILIRRSTLHNVLYRPGYTELSLRLEDYVTEDGDFRAQFRTLCTEEKPTIVLELPEPNSCLSTGSELGRERWHQIAAACALSPHYEDLLLFRPVQIAPQQNMVEISVEFYSPHLKADQGMTVQILSRDGIAATSIAAQPMGIGTAAVEWERLKDGFTLAAHPFRQFGCLYEVEAEELAAAAPKPQPRIPPQAGNEPDPRPRGPAIPVGWSQRLIHRLGELIPDPNALLTVLRDHLSVIAPQDETLQAHLGILYEKLGEYNRAYEALRQVPVDKLPDEARLALLRASNRIGASVDHKQIVEFLDLSRDDNIRALAAVVQNTVDSRAHAALRYLLEENPPFDETGLVSFLNGWQDSYQDANVISTVAEYLYLFLDAAVACEYLICKIDSHPELVKSGEFRTQVLDYAARCDRYPAELSLVLEEELDDALRRDDYGRWEQVRSLLPKLSRPQAVALLEKCAYTASLAGMIGVQLLLELSRLLRESGRTEETIPIMEQAVNLADSSPELLEAVQVEQEKICACLKQMEELNQFRVPAEQAAKERLRSVLKGKRMVIIGGREQAWAETLRQDLALEKIDWKASERNQRTDYSHVEESIRSGGTDIIVLLYDKVGHTGLDNLKSVAKRHRVPFIEARLGYSSVLWAVDRFYADLAAPDKPLSRA